jgi:hypothetical protein
MGASSEVGAGAAAAGTSRDVAIGVAKGLKAEAIRTYVMTLRQFSQADVFLYVDALPADMPAYDGVHFLLFDQQKLPHPWHRCASPALGSPRPHTHQWVLPCGRFRRRSAIN